MSKNKSKLGSFGADLSEWEIELVETLSLCENINEPIKYYEQLKDLGEKFKINQDIQQTSEFFKALGNKYRLIILESLKDQDRCVCELEAILQKSQPAVSHHLRKLEKVDLIKGWKKGKFTHYSLRKKNFNKIAGLLSELVVNSSNWFSELT